MREQSDDDPPGARSEQPTPAAGEIEGSSAEDAGEVGASSVEQSPETAGRRARALGIAAAATMIAVVAAVIAGSGGGSSAKPAGERRVASSHGIGALLAGIPQSGNTLGSPTAPVTLQYFVDLECTTARGFTLAALPVVIRTWVRSGKLRIEYRSLRTVSEPEVFGVQQVAALAAGKQDKLWYYLEHFYHEQGREHSGYVTEGYLQSLARQVPDLNRELWSEYRHDPQLAAQVTDDEHAAHAAHLHSTPSFMIGRTGSAPVSRFGESATLADINNAVRQVLYARDRSGKTTVQKAESLGAKNNHM